MFSELAGLLASLDISKGSAGNSAKSKARNILMRANKQKIGSISAYSSNSIFYFPTIVSDQMMPSEQAMIIRMIEKNYASFVVACVSLLPVHHISADDSAAITNYLQIFHQNMGMKSVDPNVMAKVFGYASKTLQESTGVSEDDFKAFQDFLYECWQKSKETNQDYIKIVSETVSINDMFTKDPIDPRTKLLQEQFNRQNAELEEWGFLGEATADMFDDDMELTDDDYDDLDEEDPDDEDEDPELNNMIDRMLGENASMNEGNVHQSINSIKFSIESVSENKILSCQSLTKLNAMEGKLNKLKGKYAKYLNRYKAKVKENKEEGTKKSLTIRFNNAVISNPKAFMQQYGEYIKIINKRLKMIEKRRKILRDRKGLSESAEVNPLIDLTQMDFDAIDYCIRSIDECITAKDEDIFILTEAKDDDNYTRIKVSEKNKLLKAQQDLIDAQEKMKSYEEDINSMNKTINSQKTKINSYSNNDTILKKTQKDLKDARDLIGTYQDDADEYKRTIDKKDTELNKIRDAKAKSARIMPKESIRPFERSVFTDMDVKKANDALPMFAKATISFVVDDTGEVLNRDLLIGIKAYMHLAPAAELVTDIYNCIINKRKFLRFVKFITGEERSLSDLLFGINELKTDALSNKSESGRWRSAFRSRRRWSKISIPKLMKEYTPNGTLVITMNEVNYLKDQYGIDIMRSDHVKMLMDADFLLGFVIIDQANEMVYVTYDGHGYGFQQYTYNMLEREAQVSQREMMQLYRAFKS